jgi:hypothetical protein
MSAGNIEFIFSIGMSCLRKKVHILLLYTNNPAIMAIIRKINTSENVAAFPIVFIVIDAPDDTAFVTGLVYLNR